MQRSTDIPQTFGLYGLFLMLILYIKIDISFFLCNHNMHNTTACSVS